MHDQVSPGMLCPQAERGLEIAMSEIADKRRDAQDDEEEEEEEEEDYDGESAEDETEVEDEGEERVTPSRPPCFLAGKRLAFDFYPS